MKKRFLTSVIGGLTALLLFIPVYADAAAQSAVVIEQSTGRVLYENNAYERLPMASTTKIMTCLLALEHSSPSELVTVAPEASGVEGSSIYLAPGETITMEELLYGLMIASGNDAACAIAIHISGDIPTFCELMNKKAQELGANDTHFESPNGLHSDSHYTTASDLALIASAAMENEDFRKIVSTTSKDLSADEDSPARYLRSKNKILYLCEGGNGIKTGYTKAAGKCLAAAALRGDMQLISVVLNDYDMFPDSIALLDGAFSEYSMQTVINKNDVISSLKVEDGVTDSLMVGASQDISLPLSANEFNIVERQVELPEVVTAPIEEGDTVGSISFSIDGEELARTDIISMEAVGKDTFLHYLKRVLGSFIHGGETFEDSEISGVGGSSVEAQGGGNDF